MKKSIKIFLGTIMLFVFFYNFSMGNNFDRIKSINLFDISLAMAADTEGQICDLTTGAFCKNNPGTNNGYCVSNGEFNGVCCVFSQDVNRDCFDVGH